MKFFSVILLLCSAAFAQTTVTGTIVDSNGNAYANGTASAASVSSSGQASTSTTPVATNGAGLFTLVLPANTYIFTVCAPPTFLGTPNTNPAPKQVCFSSNPIAISGGAQDVSTQLNASAAVLGPLVGTVTGATVNGGLVKTGNGLGLRTDCGNNQSTIWNGAAWVCGSGATGFPVTSAQQVPNGGTISPAGSGLIIANTDWWIAGPPQPSFTMSLSGGNFSSGHAESIRIAFNVGSLTTLTGQNQQLANSTNGCTSGSTCSVTVTAPTLPAWASGYSVYQVDCGVGPPLCIGGEKLVTTCQNITTNCTFGTNGTGATIPTKPTISSAFNGITVGTTTCSPGTNPMVWIADGPDPSTATFYPYLGVDATNTGTNPPGPFNKLSICRIVWLNDTGFDPPGGRNSLFAIAHLQNGAVVNINNQDRGMFIYTSNCAPLGSTCADSSAHYGLEGFQVEQDLFGTPSINGSPDAEVTAGSFQTSINATANYNSNSFGTNGIRVTNTRGASAAIDTAGQNGAYISVSNQSTVNGASVTMNALRLNCGSVAASATLNCAYIHNNAPSNTGLFQWTYGWKQDSNASFAAADPRTGGNRYNGFGDFFIDNRQIGWYVKLNAPVFLSEIDSSNGRTIPLVDPISVTGGVQANQTAQYNGGSFVSCTGGASTYNYVIVVKDVNGGAVSSTTINTAGTCVNPLTSGNPVTLSLGTPYNAGIASLEVYRTGGPMATGKIATITCTITDVLVNGQSLTCQGGGANFTDTGLTADGGAVPTVNTTGQAKFPGYLAANGNKFFVTSNFTTANNTNFQAITGLAFNLDPSAKNYQFHCSISWQQGTANVAVAFGIQAATVGATNIFANGTEQITVGPPATIVTGTLATLTTTTATSIVSGTPTATATNYVTQLDGTIEEPANDAGNTINIMVSTAAGADAVTVLRGSYCYVY